MTFSPSKLLPRRRWQRVLVGVVVGLLLFLAAAWLVGPRLMEPTIRRKLQAMVSSRLDARLDLGSLSYLPPYGVRVRDAALVAPDPATGDVQVLKIGRLDLRLAKPPWKKGPLVIKSLDVQQPEVRLIQTADGLIGSHGLVRKQPEPQTQPAENDVLSGKRKLSDMFELRHFVIREGQVVYEDRTRPGSVPMVWRGFEVDLKTGPATKGLYTYTLDASHGDVARLQSSGTYQIDEFVLDAQKLGLTVNVDADAKSSPLPAVVQGVLRDNGVRGRLSIDAKGNVPLRDPSAASGEATIHLTDASAKPTRARDFPLDRLNVRLFASLRPQDGATSWPATVPVATQPAPPGILVRLDAFDATSTGREFSLDPAELRIDPAANTWALPQLAGRIDFGPGEPIDPTGSHAPDLVEGGPRPPSRPIGKHIKELMLAGELRFTARGEGPLRLPPDRSPLDESRIEAVVYPRGFRFRPPKFPFPLENVGNGSAALRGNVLVFQNLTARYGRDEILLKGSRLRLPAHLSDVWKRGYRFEEIEGSITFHTPRQPYSRKLEKTFDRLNPEGTFLIGGGSYFDMLRVRPPPGGIDPPSDGWWKATWFFDIAADGQAAFFLGPRRVPVRQMRGYATVSSMLIDIKRLEGELFGGRGQAAGNITPGKPWIYQGRVALRDADLKQVGEFFVAPEKRSAKLSGRGNLNIELAGTMTPDWEGGNRPKDTFRAAGEFEVLDGDFWSLPGLAEVAERVRKNNPLTVGEMAGIFDVSDREIRFRRAAVSSPALGLIGSGTLGFDKTLDLNFTAAPLGDWRDRLRQAKIPIVSDVAANVAGGVQQLLNGATGTLLYQFRVTGEVSKPQVQVVPAPVLSDPAALLFGRMLEPRKDRPLIQDVRE